MSSEAFAALGAFLTVSEAEALAIQFATGQHSARALAVVNAARREEAQRLLKASDLSHINAEIAAGVLRAIAGAKSVQRDLMPVWTMPGNEARIGHLTGEFHRLVQAARQSVVCATYNFERTSQMWTVLKEASEQPGLVITVYVDGNMGDADAVKLQIPQATIYKSAELYNGKRVISHAKFIVIDHEVLLLTSANFSYSAENRNVEFGILVRDSALAESVELTMTSKHGSLYELA